jgi:isoleucyl-tRNA synthetase
LPHTSEEIWDVVPEPRRGSSVHLAGWPEPDPRWDDPQRDEHWDHLRRLRDLALVALEKMRKNKEIGGSQEAMLRIHTDDEGAARLDCGLLATMCLVSEVHVTGDRTGPVPLGEEDVTAELSPHAKCQRCWNHRAAVGQDPEYPTLCDRCARVVSELGTAGPGEA